MALGVARLLESTPRTRSGALIGSPHAMSPEQVRGEPVGPPWDIDAVGVLAYHLLAGKPPFTGTVAFVLHAHAFSPPAMISSLRSDLPGGVDAVLAKQPENRPVTARAFAGALAALLPARAAAAAAGGSAPAASPAPADGESVSSVSPTLKDQPGDHVDDGAGLPTLRVASRGFSAIRGAHLRRPVAGVVAAGAALVAAAVLITMVRATPVRRRLLLPPRPLPPLPNYPCGHCSAVRDGHHARATGQASPCNGQRAAGL